MKIKTATVTPTEPKDIDFIEPGQCFRVGTEYYVKLARKEKLEGGKISEVPAGVNLQTGQILTVAPDATVYTAPNLLAFALPIAREG